MKRWLLLVPLLALQVACDSNSNPPPATTDASSSAQSTCQSAGGACSADANCCSGLMCNTDKGICQNNSTCLPVGQTCSGSSDCCGSASCVAGYCQLPTTNNGNGTQSVKPGVKR
jgi:hypothetical protein